MSQTLINLDIIYEEFETIVDEKEKYDRLEIKKMEMNLVKIHKLAK